MPTLLHDLGIEQLNSEQKLQLIGEIWDSLGSDEQDDIPPEHLRILEKRIAAADANPEAGVPWEAVLERFRSRS